MAFHQRSSSEKNSDISQIRSYLSEMCDYISYFYYDYTEMSKSFSQIVYHLRQLDGAAVAQAYESLEGMCPTHNVYIKYELLYYSDLIIYAHQKMFYAYFNKL